MRSAAHYLAFTNNTVHIGGPVGPYWSVLSPQVRVRVDLTLTLTLALALALAPTHAQAQLLEAQLAGCTAPNVLADALGMLVVL